MQEMTPLALKIKGNKLFSPLANLDSEDDLSKIWRVCTKVKGALENGPRLENLSWRLWFRHHLLTERTNALFQKLSRKTARQLDRQPPIAKVLETTKQMGEQTGETADPQTVVSEPFTATASTNAPFIDTFPAVTLISGTHEYPDYGSQSRRQEESELSDLREQNQFLLHQFTTDQASDQMVELDDIFGPLDNSLDYMPSMSMSSVAAVANTIMQDIANNDISSRSYFGGVVTGNYQQPEQRQWQWQLATAAPYFGSDVPETGMGSNSTYPVPHEHSSFSVPTSPILYPFHDNRGDSALYVPSDPFPLQISLPETRINSGAASFACSPHSAYCQEIDMALPMTTRLPSPKTSESILALGHAKEFGCSTTSATTSLLGQATLHEWSLRASATSGDEPAKLVCSNCEATSTPLWRRSTNDELLCNACGLYQKMHNAPRPKSIKSHTGRKDHCEARTQFVCSNCTTTRTPLWRRDDAGSTLCNACGLYLKLHHERRPLSMKTDVIKKRQRNEGSTQGRTATKRRGPSKQTSMINFSLSQPSICYKDTNQDSPRRSQ